MSRIERLALVALMACASSALAQDRATTIVFGKVRAASGGPVTGADVWIEGTQLRAASSDSGEFLLNGAPPGRVTVFARRLGFYPDSKRVLLKPGDTKQVHFVLEKMQAELDAVLVTTQPGEDGRLSEFWTRRGAGFGVFMTRADIEKRRAQRSVDLFRMVNGLRVLSADDGGMTRLVSSRQSVPSTRGRGRGVATSCSMQYYVDGIFMPPGWFSVDQLTPDMIEAIEIYRGPSEIPARFNQKDTACGLVVIWTREPPRRDREP